MKKIFKKWAAGVLAALLTMIFAVPGAAAISPSSPNQYPGIDVSSYQGDIDFAAVRAAGIQVVYIRSSVGSGFVDATFAQNYQRAKAAGLQVGFYHYVTARSEAEARQQAQFFVSTISGTQPDCRLAMDFESFGDLSVAQINAIGQAFIQTVAELSGKEVVLYSNAYTARTVWSPQMAASYPLWVAHYGVDAPGDSGAWQSWVGWQYTSTGSVPGIGGNVDRDRFTDGILLSGSSIIPDPGLPEEVHDTCDYTVQPGDTVWGIARYFGTTVDCIAEINGLQDPSLIYPGQVLRILCEGGGTGSGGSGTYTVQAGDTLWDIARYYGTTVSALAATNGIEDPSLIFPGQVLIIPGGGTGSIGNGYYTIVWGDTLWDLARRFGTTVSYLAELNGIQDPNLIYAGETIRI
ncbi:LysM peptidoglycan-binding domain-containing protein [Neobittarella massiliensis]|uniref:LysM peptidoglycan-binding domain-containing protein n=1 Tax=Neobittarella massiliensis (ex Bilen et al. 2018) TaxID=2041842 RepID=UPI000CF60B49|nr:LysM peptidoglycan-binding domain-containing protein [Neobittarella massiliensis]